MLADTGVPELASAGATLVGRYFLFTVALIPYILGQGMEVPVRFDPLGDTVLNYTFESVPIWSGGAVVAIEGNRSTVPIVRVFDAEGRQVTVVAVKRPGADWISIARAARGVGGLIAICGSAKDSGAHVAGFLAFAGANGKITTLVRTEPYVPTAVSVSPDGTVWTKGAEFVPIKRTPSKTESGIIRHFDASGKPLAEFLPQSSLNRRELFLGIDQLASSLTRVGWYQGRGAVAYFEVVKDRLERYATVETDATEGAESISGLTITEDGRVFVTKSTNGNNPELYMLDREARRWNRVSLPAGGVPPTTNWLLGGSSNILIFKTTEASHRLRRFQIRGQ
jgi:hypothetical protein